MLRELKIENYAIIEHLDIELFPGLNIITGETGAGKSILLGALSLLGGARADAAVIRDGAVSCVVEAVFEVSAYREALQSVWDENDLEWEDEITVRRVVAATGKSRAFIDDVPVTLTVLRAVADRLVDIHSQHQTLLLGAAGFQTQLVDAVAGQRPQVAQYVGLYKQLNDCRTEYAQALQTQQEATKERDYLQFQLDQLLGLKLRAGEVEELEAEQNLLTHAEEIAQNEAAKEAFDALDGKPIPKVAQLSKEYTALLAEKRAEYEKYKALRQEMITLRTAKQNVDRILGIEQEAARSTEMNR